MLKLTDYGGSRAHRSDSVFCSPIALCITTIPAGVANMEQLVIVRPAAPVEGQRLKAVQTAGFEKCPHDPARLGPVVN